MQPTYDTPTMAELYFQQGHVNQAIETYRRIVTRDPGDSKAQQRLDELEMMAGIRREIPAKIAELTREFVVEHRGVVACAIMGFDGIAVEISQHEVAQMDCHALLIEYSDVATSLLKLGSKDDGVGKLTAATFSHNNAEILIHRLNDDYFLAAVLDSRAIAGQIRFSLRMVVPRLIEALEL